MAVELVGTTCVLTTSCGAFAPVSRLASAMLVLLVVKRPKLTRLLPNTRLVTSTLIHLPAWVAPEGADGQRHGGRVVEGDGGFTPGGVVDVAHVVAGAIGRGGGDAQRWR